MKLNSLYSLAVVALLSCQDRNTSKEAEQKQIEVVKTESNTKSITADENFHEFLKKFNQDSLFQMSRITFPLKITTIDDNFDSIEEVINKEEYTKMDFTYPIDALTRELDRYTQKIKLSKDTAVIQVRGYDNGIYTDIIFENKNGKWHLKTWNDQST